MIGLLIRAAAVSVMALHGSAGFSQTNVRTARLSPTEAGKEPPPIWSGNSLLTIESTSSSAPIVRIHGQDGAEIQRVSVQIPGADLVNVYNNLVARSKDGYLAVGGTAYGGGNRGAAFVAVITPDGSHQVLVRTNPYGPGALTFAADGTIWVAGVDSSGVDYFIIRRLDKNGGLLGQALSSSRFAGTPRPASASQLVSSKDRVGWFSPVAHVYMEFSLDGKELATYPASVSELDAQGMAMCEDDSVWMAADAEPGSQMRPAQGPGDVRHSVVSA